MDVPPPTVGFLLLPKKVHRVVTPNLVRTCHEQFGIGAVALDKDHPELWQQWMPGLDVVVHKVPDDEEALAQLQRFVAQNPGVQLVDDPRAVHRLDDRATMLEPLAAPGLLLQEPHAVSAPGEGQPRHQFLAAAPPQAVIPEGCSYKEAVRRLEEAGVALPAVAKPSCALTCPPHPGAARQQQQPAGAMDGHTLGLVQTLEGLAQVAAGQVPGLRPPLVLQQYVAHGDALYKLYVIGPHAVLTRRPTLTAAAAAAACGASGWGLLTQRISATAPALQPTKTQHVACRGDARAAAGSSPPHTTPQSGAHTGAVCANTSAATIPVGSTGSSAGGRPVDPGPGAAASSSSRNTAASLSPLGGRPGAPAAAVLVESCPRPLQQQPLALQSGLPPSYGPGLPLSFESGVLLRDEGVRSDPRAPPAWAALQLSQLLRQRLNLNLFNVDIIVPQQLLQPPPLPQQQQHLQQQPPPPQQHQQQRQAPLHLQQPGQLAQLQTHALPEGPAAEQQCPAATAALAPQDQQLLYVVDINYFPGYDKVAGAEELLADFLAEVSSTAREVRMTALPGTT